jgi:hypothetical protein
VAAQHLRGVATVRIRTGVDAGDVQELVGPDSGRPQPRDQHVVGLCRHPEQHLGQRPLWIDHVPGSWMAHERSMAATRTVAAELSAASARVDDARAVAARSTRLTPQQSRDKGAGMGFNTEDLGHLEITPHLNAAQVQWLSGFADWGGIPDGDPFALPMNPRAELAAAFDRAGGSMSLRGHIPHGVHDWRVCEHGDRISRRRGDKSNDAVASLRFLVSHYLGPGCCRSEVQGGDDAAYLKLLRWGETANLRRCGHRWDGRVLAWLRPRCTQSRNCSSLAYPASRTRSHPLTGRSRISNGITSKPSGSSSASSGSRRTISPPRPRGHRHVAVDEEGQPTKHPLLRDVEIVDHEVADSLCQLRVVCHAPVMASLKPPKGAPFKLVQGG